MNNCQEFLLDAHEISNNRGKIVHRPGWDRAKVLTPLSYQFQTNPKLTATFSAEKLVPSKKAIIPARRAGLLEQLRQSHHSNLLSSTSPIAVITATHEQQTEIPRRRTEDDSPWLPLTSDGPPQAQHPPTLCAAPAASLRGRGPALLRSLCGSAHLRYENQLPGLRRRRAWLNSLYEIASRPFLQRYPSKSKYSGFGFAKDLRH